MSESESYLLGELEKHLGKGRKTSKDNYSFHCPFCNHKKPKLEIDLNTNEKGENKFACWVCGTKGRKISILLRLIKVPKEEAVKVLRYVKKGSIDDYYAVQDTKNELKLPDEFKSLMNLEDNSSTAKRARKYLSSRGLTDFHIRKYQIGYADQGEYEDRIIIPSYDEFGILEMFITRSIKDSYNKYLKPEVDTTDLVFFKNFIDWNKPVILCEGVFDAMAIQINSIPLLGKFAKPGLKKLLLEHDTPAVYIALDEDAKKEAIKLGEDLLKIGLKVFLVELKGKDPGEIGYKKFKEYYLESTVIDTKTLLKYKLNGI